MVSDFDMLLALKHAQAKNQAKTFDSTKIKLKHLILHCTFVFILQFCTETMQTLNNAYG